MIWFEHPRQSRQPGARFWCTARVCRIAVGRHHTWHMVGQENIIPAISEKQFKVPTGYNNSNNSFLVAVEVQTNAQMCQRMHQAKHLGADAPALAPDVGGPACARAGAGPTAGGGQTCLCTCRRTASCLVVQLPCIMTRSWCCHASDFHGVGTAAAAGNCSAGEGIVTKCAIALHGVHA